jgi:preprotein translocase subunit SecD
VVEVRTDDLDLVQRVIGKSALLEFREQKTVDGQRRWVTVRQTGTDGAEKDLNGRYLKRVETEIDQAGRPEILFELDSQGTKLFADATTRLRGQQLGIFIDDQAITTPTVQEPITQGRGRITGSFTIDEARELAIQLNSGALPLPVALESR